MFSTLLFWFIWLFIFIPVVLWVVGFVLPLSAPKNQSTGTDTTPSSTTQSGA